MSEKIIVEVEQDILDLAPVLLKSLNIELEEIEGCAQQADYSGTREKIHSSRGAALTFGFSEYVQLLLVAREAAMNENQAALLSICTDLKEMLENVEFIHT